MKTLLLILQFIISVSLIIVVLLQQSKGEGLGSIGGGAQMFFGKTKGIDRVLERATTIFAVLFMVFSIVLTIVG